MISKRTGTTQLNVDGGGVLSLLNTRCGTHNLLHTNNLNMCKYCHLQFLKSTDMKYLVNSYFKYVIVNESALFSLNLLFIKRNRKVKVNKLLVSEAIKVL